MISSFSVKVVHFQYQSMEKVMKRKHGVVKLGHFLLSAKVDTVKIPKNWLLDWYSFWNPDPAAAPGYFLTPISGVLPLPSYST